MISPGTVLAYLARYGAMGTSELAELILGRAGSPKSRIARMLAALRQLERAGRITRRDDDTPVLWVARSAS